MSGIVGVWNRSGAPVSRTLLHDLATTVGHRGPDGLQLWTSGPVGLACCFSRILPEDEHASPIVERAGCVLMLDGRFDDREQLLDKLPASISLCAASPDNELALAAYLRFGEPFAEHLNGDFALAVFDTREQRLILVRDSIGARPLYWATAGNTFLFASEMKAIVSHPEFSRSPNERWIAEALLGAWNVPPGETCFRGVRSVLPAHALVVTAEREQQRKYWDFDPEKRIRHRTFEEYGEELAQHFGTAVRRRIRSHAAVAVSVSGGLDSSSIFCVALQASRCGGSPAPVIGISNITSGDVQWDEKKFLVDIEAKYGTEIARIPLPEVDVLSFDEDAIWRVEVPRSHIPWSVTAKFYPALTERGARVVLTGHWGDQVLFVPTYLVDLVSRLRWLRAWREVNEFSRWMTNVPAARFQKLFFRDLVRAYVPRAVINRVQAPRRLAPSSRQVFTESLWRQCQPPQSRPRRFSSFYAEALYRLVRSPYHVANLEADNKMAASFGVEQRAVFLDRELLAFLLAIPPEIAGGNGVVKGLFRQAMRDVLPEPILARRWKAQWTAPVKNSIQQHWGDVQQLFEGGSMAQDFGLVRGGMFRKELSAVRMKPEEWIVDWSVSDAFALELWLRTFFGNAGTQVEKTIGGITGGSRKKSFSHEG